MSAPNHSNNPTVEEVREWLAYDAETGIITWKKSPAACVSAGAVAGFLNQDGYRQATFKRKLHGLHRLAWVIHHGRWPANQIDHINQDRSDNRLCNLREADPHQNAQNVKRKPNKTGYPGVKCVKGRYESRICVKFKRIALGSFATAEEAHKAYIEAKRNLHTYSQESLNAQSI